MVALEPILGMTHGLVIYQEQVMEIAQKLAGYTPGQCRPAATRHGQEEEGSARQGVRPLLRRDEGQGLQRGVGRGALGCPRPLLGLRVQQGAHRGIRAGVVLDRLPQGELPGRVHGGPAHQRRRRQGQVRPLLGECRRMGIKVLPPDVNESVALRGCRQRHPLRPCRRSATSGTTSSTRSSGPARRRAPSRPSRTSSPSAGGRGQQADHRVAHQGRCLRRPRREADGPAARARGVCRRLRRDQEAGGDRAGQPFGSFGDDAGAVRRPTCSA